MRFGLIDPLRRLKLSAAIFEVNQDAPCRDEIPYRALYPSMAPAITVCYRLHPGGGISMESEFARALAALTTGIYVLTVSDGETHHGMSSSWVAQVSGVPPLFTAAVDSRHFSCGVVMRTGKFALNVVGSRGRELEDYFYSARARRPDNLASLEYELSPVLRVPWLKLAMVSIEARLAQNFVIGDHSIFVGELVGVRIGANDRPLTSLDLDYVYLGGSEVIPRDRSGL
jgi:flavin reductase (DIM6/NTAB) family NADH-FMN oxidoreductase RutF